MKLFKIGMVVVWIALLLNCAANVWVKNYILAGSEATTLLCMVAYWFLLCAYERLLPIVDREESWDVSWHGVRRWLAEFPDAVDALDYVRREVDGVRPFDIQRLRDNMRARRDEGTR